MYIIRLPKPYQLIQLDLKTSVFSHRTMITLVQAISS